MSKIRRLYATGALLGFALLAGCETVPPEEAAITPVQSQAAAAPEPAGVIKVPETTEDQLAQLQASFEQAQSTSGPGAPLMWTLKDSDTTLYLFGTVHILRPEIEWRTADFDAAFGAADKLVVEADVSSPEGQQALAALIPKYAVFQDGNTLTGVLDDEDEEIIETALASLNIPIAAMDTVKPWFVGLQMSVMQMVQAGYDPESGLETILTAEANKAGKRLGFLETAEDQFSVIAGGELEDQIDGLVFASETLELGPQLLDGLVSEWADGDLAGLSAIIANPVAFGGEDAYNSLLVERNRNWIPQIKAMLDEPGTVFIAVGAAHLAGDDSVIKMLRDEGLEVAGPQ